MKKKDIQELHTKTTQELKKQLKEERDELFSLKLELSQHKLKNTSSLTNKRRDIARIQTIIRGKELLVNHTE